jgi:hypothetical protein
METWPGCGHPRNADTTYLVRDKYPYCKTCKNVRQSQWHWARGAGLSKAQVSLLRRIAAGLPAGDERSADAASLRAVIRRGLVQRSGGAYRLTEAGEQALAALASAP